MPRPRLSKHGAVIDEEKQAIREEVCLGLPSIVRIAAHRRTQTSTRRGLFHGYWPEFGALPGALECL